MYVILWRFRVRPGLEPAFETAYGPEGAWALLFRADPAFLGTTLMRATDGTYLTLDRWDSEDSAVAFRARHATAYAALDARCEALTEAETRLGAAEI